MDNRPFAGPDRCNNVVRACSEDDDLSSTLSFSFGLKLSRLIFFTQKQIIFREYFKKNVLIQVFVRFNNFNLLFEM